MCIIGVQIGNDTCFLTDADDDWISSPTSPLPQQLTRGFSMVLVTQYNETKFSYIIIWEPTP